MATTTNFGWETPDDTDLVKDGALAMRTLGNAIDTSLVDLKGGTTGQVLSKASNTDLDFSWVAQDDSNAIQNAIVDAKGDLISATAADTPARLAVGANGTVLTADSAETTGLKWVAPASGSLGSFTLLNSGGTLLTGATTITVSGISAKAIMAIVTDGASAGSNAFISFRLNGDSALKYSSGGFRVDQPSTYSTTMIANYDGYRGSTDILFARMGSNTASVVGGSLLILSADTSGFKSYTVTGGGDAGGGNTQRAVSMQGIYEATAAITSISVLSDTGNFDGGRIYVFGAN